MFKWYYQLSGKNKLLAISAGLLLLYSLSTLFAFKNTFDAYQTNSRLKHKLNTMRESPQRMAELQAEIAKINDQSRRPYSREELFAALSEEALNKDLIISGFEEEHQSLSKGVFLATNPVKVTGSYQNIVQFLYAVEQERKIANISSAQFVIGKGFDGRRKNLEAKVFLQHTISQQTEN